MVSRHADGQQVLQPDQIRTCFLWGDVWITMWSTNGEGHCCQWQCACLKDYPCSICGAPPVLKGSKNHVGLPCTVSMDDGGLSGDVSGVQTSKINRNNGVFTASGSPGACFTNHEQTDCRRPSSEQVSFRVGHRHSGREPEISGSEGTSDLRKWKKAGGMVACNVQYSVGLGVVAGPSMAVGDGEERVDEAVGHEGVIREQPSYCKLRTLSIDAHDTSSRKDLPDKLLIMKSDPRVFFNRQAEKYRQEFRQQQIQQWVLKHNFSQESLPSDCWPDQYPQITAGDEQQNADSAQKLMSGNVEGIDEYRRQETSTTQSLYKEPPINSLMKTNQKQAHFVSNDAVTDNSGIIHEFEGISAKRRKLADSKEDVDRVFPCQAASALCEQPFAAAVVVGMDARDMGSGNDPTLRQWLSESGRIVDRFECLHIFKQILEFVDLAHAQGVVLRNVRPSSFILSSLHRVSFLDSASSRSSSGSSEPSTGTASIQASLLGTVTPSDGTAVQNEGRTILPSQLMAQQNRDILRSQLVEEQHQQDGCRSRFDLNQIMTPTKRMETFHDGLRAKEESDFAAWGSGTSKRSSLNSQRSGSSGMEWLGDLRVSADACRGFPSTRTMLVAGKSEIHEDPTRTSSQLFLSDNLHQDDCFPVRPTLLMEDTWYASPEELLDGTCSYASDMYSLGVLFFELFCPFSSWEDHSRLMSDLRHRILPPRLLSDRPKEAAFCLWLLHPEPNSRPKAREVLQCELLNEVGEALAERQAAMNIEEKEAETELLLDFLLRVQHEKQDLASKLAKDLSCLTSDIEEVKRRRSLLQHSAINSVSIEDQDRSNKLTQDDRVSRSSSNPKDFLVRDSVIQEEQSAAKLGQCLGEQIPVEFKQREMHEGVESVRRQEDLRSKCARLMSNFDQLEQVYFAMRWKVEPQISDSTRKFGGQKQGTRSASAAIGTFDFDSEMQKTTEFNDIDAQEGKDSLGCFFDSLCKYARYSRFEVKAALRHGDLLNTANMVCSLSFDRDQEYFATAGVCKRIKVFECDAVLNENVDIHYPVVEMISRSKLSSICWNNYIKSHIASSDYDGVVQLWDASTGQALMRYEEHEKRAWSVDFSQADPTKLASGSDDGSVKLWSINQDGSIGTIKTKANVCCVQFPRDSAHLIAFGSADYKIYCYDLRNIRIPWCTLASHSKTVSYVKFLDAGTLVSASTDNTLKLWDLSRTSSAGSVSRACILTYTGHTNEKNFVGLSVMDGYIACGSETNSVFAYHKSLPMPMASHKFGCADPISGQETEDDSGQFVSSVCWRGKSQTLVAANSMGNIKVLEMV